MVEGIELKLHDFCSYCGGFEADVTVFDISTIEDIFNKKPKFRTYIDCKHSEICRIVADKVMESKNEKP